MYDDLDADFWKEKLVQLVKNNMTQNSQRFSRENCAEEFRRFSNRFKEFTPEIQENPSYIIWEIFITEDIKLRLYIQNQIKISLQQKASEEFIKIADGKLLYNPFPQIYEFLDNLESYKAELKEKQQLQMRFNKQQQLTGELIKALLKKKIGNKKIIWNLEKQKMNSTSGEFLLIVEDKGEKVSYPITMKNFVSEIQNLDFQEKK